MKILLLHNRYRLAGGEDAVVSAERALLASRGHDVRLHEVSNGAIGESVSPLRAGGRALWSVAAEREVARLLAEIEPDVVHVHNFFPLLSPSVHFASRRAGAAVVQTLHNYRLICPKGTLFRDGRPCEDCVGRAVPWPSVLHGCYRGSAVATAPVAAMVAAHRVLGTWSRMVDVHIAPTRFVRDRLAEGGLARERIAVKPHFVGGAPAPGDGSGGYALFVGRIAEEKGVDVLLSAWQRLDGTIPLKIVGAGPLLERLRGASRGLRNVEWMGPLPREDVQRMMRSASLLVFPSAWYETFGMVIIEAFAAGLPVVVARHGAAAELVEAGRTGCAFEPGNPSDLAAAVRFVVSHPTYLAGLRRYARAEFDELYGETRNYRLLMEIYARALETARFRWARTRLPDGGERRWSH